MKGLCFKHFIFPPVKLARVLATDLQQLSGLLRWKRLHFFQVAFCFYCKYPFFFPEGRKEAERTSGCGRNKLKKQTVRQCPDLGFFFFFFNLLQAFWPFQEFGRFRDSPESAALQTPALRCYQGAHVGILPRTAEIAQLWKGDEGLTKTFFLTKDWAPDYLPGKKSHNVFSINLQSNKKHYTSMRTNGGRRFGVSQNLEIWFKINKTGTQNLI